MCVGLLTEREGAYHPRGEGGEEYDGWAAERDTPLHFAAMAFVFSSISGGEEARGVFIIWKTG